LRPFNVGEPIAYFLTWTTYGTWLPGDSRGWNPKDGSGPEIANPLFEEMARSQMTESEFRLSTADRELVEKTIRKHCEFRGWTLHAVNPRSNHVHVVVTAPGYEPEPVYEQFKAWCTRHLKKVHTERENFWTERASRRWINYEDDLESAIRYVLDAQDGDDGATSWNR
jgi:REP element-mobilizing transposase RayT